jgi:hypothetical protein
MSDLALAIRSAIAEGKGLAVGKLGTCELDTLYIYYHKHPYNWVTRLAMTRNAGLWPDSNKTLQDWATHMEKHVLPQIDLVAQWWNAEYEGTVFRAWAPQAKVIDGIDWFEPWRPGHEWTREIPAGTKVAVVSPFHESIAAQAPNINKLFESPIWQEPLPEIIPIRTGCSPIYDSTSDAAWSAEIRAADWRLAVVHVVKQVVASGAKVALVGCGALSLPIVIALKKQGVIAIHTGGVTQMIFGIRGDRWVKDPKFTALCEREHWVSPQACETPLHAKTIERGCYWM